MSQNNNEDGKFFKNSNDSNKIDDNNSSIEQNQTEKL